MIDPGERIACAPPIPRGARVSFARRSTGFATVGPLYLAVLVWGWSIRDRMLLSPERGAGYFLGIAGIGCMALLLLYSLRKRLPAARGWGSIRRWLDVHMALGLIGPAAILFHSNFRLGSLNSTVALGCMIAVAVSGMIGRFIYPKLHDRLSGRRATLRELRQQLDSSRDAMGTGVAAPSELAAQLREFESFALAARTGLAGSVWKYLTLGHRARSLHRAARRVLRRSARAKRFAPADSERIFRAYLDAVCRVAEFSAYQRVFALWHAVHLPICSMLFAGAAVHALAVHMY